MSTDIYIQVQKKYVVWIDTQINIKEKIKEKIRRKYTEI